MRTCSLRNSNNVLEIPTEKQVRLLPAGESAPQHSLGAPPERRPKARDKKAESRILLAVVQVWDSPISRIPLPCVRFLAVEPCVHSCNIQSTQNLLFSGLPTNRNGLCG